MKKIIVTTVLGVILSTSAVAEQQKFRFEFLNEQGTKALGVGHGHFDPETPNTITIQPLNGINKQFTTNFQLTQIGITVNGTNGSAVYEHHPGDESTNDLYEYTWLNADDKKGAGYSDGTDRIDGKWRFGKTDKRNLTLNFKKHTWTQDTMQIQPEGEKPVRVKSHGLFRLRMVKSDEELDGLLGKVLDEDTPADSDAGSGNPDTPPLPDPGDVVPAAPEFNGSAIDIFDNTAVNTIVEEAKAAEEAKNTKSGSGALGPGFLMLGVLSMAIRRRWSNA